MFLQVLKVKGHSLDPVYHDGDFVLVSKVPILLAGIRPGDVVVFLHPRLGKLVKLVDRLESGGRSVYVLGLGEDSVDSRTFGAVPRSSILGKVVWHIPKK